MPSTATSEPTLFAELDRRAIVRAYIEGAWRTVRVLRYLREGKVSVALFSPKGGWRKLSKPILEAHQDWSSTIKQVLLFSALVMLVAGCNLEGEPTLVIAPGTDVIIDGERASVFGFDHCPKDEMAGLFGAFLSSHSCVVLNDDRQTVDVLVQFPTGATPERWKINTWISESGHRTVSLERPNGTFVAQGK